MSDNPDSAGNFPVDTDGLELLLSGIKATEHVSLGDQLLADARTDTLAAWNAGPGWVNFVGHGALDKFTAEGLFTKADAEALGNTQLPVVATLTCIVGNFAWSN